MAEQTEVILNQMEETRANLTEKLEALENQVTETVQSATEVVQSATEAVSETVEAVKETVENVTESVEDTVQSVGNFFDLRHQTDQHPWIIFGGSVALGCMVAQWLGGKEKTSSEGSWSGPVSTPSWYQESYSAPSTRTPQPEPQPARSEPEPARKSWLGEELDRLKNLGLGALMGVVRDMVKRSLPGELGQRVADEVDTITNKMGAQTFQESVLPEK